MAGRRYLDLQREARRSGRPTDELIQLYALEGFLDRLTRSDFSANFVLKGGVLLAALDARRPTRDIDLAAHAIDNAAEKVLRTARAIADIEVDDGLIFDSVNASAEIIREDDHYSGTRVTLSGTLARAAVRLHVDVNVGDPIWPEPTLVKLPRLLDGVLSVRGYPMEMVLAEKIVTAIARGSANTRYRDVRLGSLRAALAGYSEIAQQRWLAWLRRQRLDQKIPQEFSEVLELIISFADPVIVGGIDGGTWNASAQHWR